MVRDAITIAKRASIIATAGQRLALLVRPRCEHLAAQSQQAGRSRIARQHGPLEPRRSAGEAPVTVHTWTEMEMASRASPINRDNKPEQRRRVPKCEQPSRLG